QLLHRGVAAVALTRGVVAGLPVGLLPRRELAVQLTVRLELVLDVGLGLVLGLGLGRLGGRLHGRGVVLEVGPGPVTGVDDADGGVGCPAGAVRGVALRFGRAADRLGAGRLLGGLVER